MPLASLTALKNKRVLLLQGPMGLFFSRFARLLEAEGATVSRVNFNGGDWLFAPRAEFQFREPMDAWPAYLDTLLAEGGFEWVLLFGDCRPIHREAQRVAEARGVRVGVFEEGYLRPNFVTLEEGGVNARSSLSRDPDAYRDTSPGPVPEATVMASAFGRMALFSTAYYVAAACLSPWFPHYRHHRPLTIAEAWPWVRSWLRKLHYRRREAGIEARLTTAASKRYFLVPLQVHNDAQVTVHSSFGNVQRFIVEVLESFAAHAPGDTELVFKHHPLDRAYNDYTTFIRTESERLKLVDRVVYIHDQHLPSLLNHARGAVVINSTVGLQALDHSTPLKVCGHALYDMDGLTFRGSLDAFWSATTTFEVDATLLRSFKRQLVLRTQLGGSFYRKLPSGEVLEVIGSARRHEPSSVPEVAAAE